MQCEHSTFVKKSEVSDVMLRKLRGHPSIRSALVEDDWIRLRFQSRKECQQFCHTIMQNGGATYEGAISPVLRWMVDNDIKVDEPRTIWVDLEADSRVPFSRKEQMRILCWSAVNRDQHTEHGMLRENTDKDERRLLGELWEVLDQYDQVAAWNGDGFDFPVIYARSQDRRLLAGRDWRRWLWLDHLELFRRMNTAAAESGDEKQSLALDAVCQSVLGVGKMEFDASKTWEAWDQGGESRELLGKYCDVDTLRMVQLEDKTGFVKLLRTLGDACGTFADSRGVQPSVQVESYLQRIAHQRGHKFPTVKTRKGNVKYKGAFVMEPKQTGILRDVHVADFASLYPSIILTWNMSPDTFCGLDGSSELQEVIKAGQALSYSPLTRAHFKADAQGILPAAIETLLKLRAYWNQKKAEATPGTPEWKEADRRATAYKIAANSFYGVTGAPTSRFFRKDVAESVAQCGAWLILKTIEAAEKRGMDVVYGDTDSIFVVGATRAQFEEFVAWCNRELYPALLAEVGAPTNRIVLAYEKQFDRLVFPYGSAKDAAVKKRYIGSFVHYKGKAATRDSKPEIKGLEYKRGDTVRLARQLQEEVIYMLLGYQRDPVDDPVEYHDLLTKWRDRVLNQKLDLDDVVVSKGLARPLDDYKRTKKQDGTWKRQPPHVEVARIMAERGGDVTEGTKIRYFVLDGQCKPAKVAPASDWTGQLDRVDLWAKVAKPTLRLIESAFPATNWKPLGKADGNVCIAPSPVSKKRRRKLIPAVRF